MASLKHIHGEPVSHQRWKDAIIDSVADRGRATSTQVADDIGWATEQDKHRISVQMVDLAKQKWLIRERNGIYIVDPAYQKRRDRTLEADIIETVKQYGGLAQWSEIMDAFEALPSKNKQQPYDGRSNGGRHRVQAAMNNSSLIQHYSISDNEGFWGLAPDELLKVALSGRSAEFLFKHQFLESIEVGGIGGKENKEELDEGIENHFSYIGLALRRVRRLFGESLDSMAAHKGIEEAVGWAMHNSREFERAIRQEVTKQAKLRANAEGHGGDPDKQAEILEDEMGHTVVHALALMEQGSLVAHRAAPAALFYSYGKAFKVCPAFLSRGMLVHAAPNECHDKLESKGGRLP